MKKCNRCFIEKQLEEFCNKTSSKDGKGNTCFPCVKEYNDNYCKNPKNIQKQKEYYLENKKHIIKRVKKYHENNPNYNKEYYLKNKEEHDLRTKSYYQNNKEAHYERTLKWKNNNPDRYKELILLNSRRRLKEDIEYKIKQCISSTIHSALKRNSKNKTNRTIFYIGCNINFLQNHLEAQFLPEFTWENYGEVWEIDHIKGCCNFDLTKEEEQLKCFHFSNLQPLFKTTKIAKEYGYNNIIGNRNKPKYL